MATYECARPRRVLANGRDVDVPCRSRSCPGCGQLWLQDQRIRTIAAAQQLGGAVALVTVTAPGKDVLPWDESGGQVEANAARLWNNRAPANWRALHDQARAVARRRHPQWSADWRLLMKAWEYQKRGVLHLHLIVPMGTAAHRAVSTAYVRALAAGAPRHRFGFVDRGKLPESGPRTSARQLEAVAPGRAALYCCAYIGGDAVGKGGISEVAKRQGVKGQVLYITPSLMKASGVTMRGLRNRRTVLMQWPGAGANQETWYYACRLDHLRRGRPPFSPETRRALFAQVLTMRPSRIIDLETGEAERPDQVPPPPQLPGGDEKVPRSTADLLVRLDSVPHHADAEVHHDVWMSVVGELRATSR